MKRFLLLLPLLLIALLVSPMLRDERRFTPDEAFFMTFARGAAVGGDWWLQGSLDKPPLTIYANAVLIALVGAAPLPDGVLTLDVYKGEFVGRLLAFFSGMAVIALTMRLALDLSRSLLAALIAGLALATLPMMQLYSATAFMDMPMLALALAALLAATRGRAAVSGLLLALAFAAKPQAVFLAPLVLWHVLLPLSLMERGSGGEVLRRLTSFALAAGGALMALLLWDVMRPGDSVFALGAANNDFFAPTLDAATLWTRLMEWLPSGLAALPVMAGALAVWACGLWNRSSRTLSVWTGAYLAGHLFLSDTLYERYLLPLTPIISIVCAVLVGHHAAMMRIDLRPHFRRAVLRSVTVLAVCAWLTSVLVSAPAETLDDQPNHALQIDRVAGWLNALPVATVIYDHWYGWLLRYYMGQWHDKRIVYFPSPQALAAGIRSLEEAEPRYLLVPQTDPRWLGLSSPWSEDTESWLEALTAAGVDTEWLDWQEAGFSDPRVYRIMP